MATLGRAFLCLLGLLCAGVPSGALGDAIPVVEIAAEHMTVQDFPLRRIVDPSKGLDVESIAAGTVPGDDSGSRFFIPTDNSDFWFVFTLRNATAAPVDLVVRLDEAFLETVDLSYRDGGNWVTQRNGLSVPLSARQIAHPWPAFPMRLAAGAERTLYLKTYSLRRWFSVGIVIEDRRTFDDRETFQLLGYGLFFGAVIALALYNLIIFVSLRDIVYFYYVCTAVNMCIFVFMFNGFNLYVFDDPIFHYKLSPSLFLAIAFLILFVRRLFYLGSTMPTINKILAGLAALYFVESILAVVDTHNRYYAPVIGAPTMLILLAVGFRAALKGIPFSRYFVLGMSWHVVGLLLLALLESGSLPYSFPTRHGYLIGSLIEMIVFSLGLADRVRLLQEEKYSAQKRLREVEEDEKRRLERLVAEQTRELRDANLELERLTKTDTLTGLHNRRHFDETMRREWTRLARLRQPLCLVIADIDHFKAYNDTYGHQAGDACLQAAADTIQASSGRDDVAARYGGEEFAVILPGCGREGGRLVATAIHQAIQARALTHPGSPFGKVTLSFGVAAVIPDEAVPPEVLFARADQALYASKAAGRNQVTVAVDAPLTGRAWAASLLPAGQAPPLP